MSSNSPGWLFRQGELILGPVGPDQIIEKIYSRELTDKSEVQRMGDGRFRPLAEIDVFRVHLAKAAAKQRVDSAGAAHETKVRKRTMVVLAISLASVLLIAAAFVAVGQYVAVHSPGADVEELAWGDIEVEAPTIARARRADDELVDYNAPGAPPRRPGTGKRPGSGASGQTSAGDDPDGMQMAAFDKSSIDDVVKKHQNSLFPCLKQVAKPGQVTKVPIEFVIGQGGRVTKVWVDNPDLKGGPLGDCLLKELQKWPFKGIDGESPTVSLSFNIKGKG
jgi:hypothetical protein